MRERGVTLIEMLLVMTLIALMAAIAFPSVTTGLDSLRLTSATDDVVTFLNTALNRAERRQQVVEVLIFKGTQTLQLHSNEIGFQREMTLPEGVLIAAVYPLVPNEPPEAPRRIYLFPGGTIPRIGIDLVNRRGVHRIVRVDPMTGVPQIERPELMVP